MFAQPLSIPDVILFTPRVFRDDRGFFMESFRLNTVQQAVGPVEFVQDNHSLSVKDTIRGLHFQSTPGQGKLVRCTRGAIWDVAVDLRRQSPTFGRWVAQELTAENCQMVYVPVGFAHGFAVLSEVAEVQYKCTSYYEGATEKGIMWNDAQVAIPWPVSNPVLSTRDQQLPTLAQWLAEG
ncbi:MAG: dTDP-4-dehydrorhamnose 3,5-epimerase [Candidatus Sumerlaeia bacterium]|nr:dTDP-4-dehydrorhamnose 3,5-epimerase [Candidatus Sumerlaeia bacterium]